MNNYVPRNIWIIINKLMRDRSRCYRRHFSKGAMRVVSRAINRLAKDSISGGKKGGGGEAGNENWQSPLVSLSPYEMRNDGIVENALWNAVSWRTIAKWFAHPKPLEWSACVWFRRESLPSRCFSTDSPDIFARSISHPPVSAKGEYDISFSYLFYLNDIFFRDNIRSRISFGNLRVSLFRRL